MGTRRQELRVGHGIVARAPGSRVARGARQPAPAFPGHGPHLLPAGGPGFRRMPEWAARAAA